jgi:hypothetical protein
MNLRKSNGITVNSGLVIWDLVHWQVDLAPHLAPALFHFHFLSLSGPLQLDFISDLFSGMIVWGHIP